MRRLFTSNGKYAIWVRYHNLLEDYETNRFYIINKDWIIAMVEK